MGYASPLPVEFGGLEQLVYPRPNGPLAYSTSGELLWEKELASDVATTITIPVLVPPDNLFLSVSYDIGSTALRLTGAGDSMKVESLWCDRVMRNHFSSSVTRDGLTYGFDNATLKCIDAATGEQKRAKRGGLGRGSLTWAELKHGAGSKRCGGAAPAPSTESATI